MTITIYHNPRCSKSREALAILEESGKEFKVVEYLKEPLSKTELLNIFKILKEDAQSLIRSKEPLFNELGLKLSDNKKWEEWSQILEKHPILMERPLIVSGKKAVIGRPPENVKSVISG